MPMTGFERYHEYVDETHTPNFNKEVIAVFRIKPAEGFTIKDCAGGVAAESSTGTSTSLYSWY
ncbi:MAG: ribulose-bisphosphate carboxylase large subunit, partial [Desulfurococcaceae archaeon]